MVYLIFHRHAYTGERDRSGLYIKNVQTPAIPGRYILRPAKKNRKYRHTVRRRGAGEYYRRPARYCRPSRCYGSPGSQNSAQIR